MSESLRNDGRIWVPKKNGDKRAPGQIPDGERDYYRERRYPSFGNLVPRDVASRNDEACLMFPKTNWTAHARRFLNRNWKFLVQTGVTILGILHK